MIRIILIICTWQQSVHLFYKNIFKKYVDKLILLCYSYYRNKKTTHKGEDDMLTKDSYIYKTTKELLQKEINACKKLLEDSREKWDEQLDLKLHEASTASIDFEYNGAKVTFTDEAQTEWFYEFCDYSYDWFKEELNAEGIDFDKLRKQIWHTSEFYLSDLHDSVSCAPAGKFWAYVLCCASETFDNSDFWVNDDLEIEDDTLEDEEVEDRIADMLETIKYIRKEVEETLKPIEFTYDLIKAFKDEQVDNFRYHVQDAWLNN